MGGFLSRLFGKAGGGADEPPADPRDSDPPSAAGHAPPAFAPVNDLERLLMAAGTDPAARPAFEKALLDGQLFVATPEAPPVARSRTIAEGESLTVRTVPNAEGGATPAIFTSQDRIVECFGPGAGYAAIEGRALLDIIAADGAALNPASSYGVLWSADDLAALLGRPVRRTLEQDTQVLLGSPKERPEALIAALSKLLRDDLRVEQAWLALAHWPDRKEECWYLDIRASADADSILPSLSGAMTPDNLAGKSIDVVVQPSNGDEGTGIRLKPLILH